MSPSLWNEGLQEKKDTNTGEFIARQTVLGVMIATPTVVGNHV